MTELVGRMIRLLLLLRLTFIPSIWVDAFQPTVASVASSIPYCQQCTTSLFVVRSHMSDFVRPVICTSNRRRLLQNILATALVSVFPSVVSWADEEPSTTTATTTSKMEMKSFIDPQGLFSLEVPKDFFTLRRTNKGDLPDAKTGKGRRGSNIFTAGNMAKAEVISVARFPTRVLLEENGIVPEGDLSTFPAIGDAKTVANLIVLRRENESQSQNQGVQVLDNIKVTPDGKQLTFRLKTEIEVQKPELLLEQYGVSRLFRVTVAKATLDSNDGNIMAIFASALEQDFNNGMDGPALEESVKSFQPMNQATSSS
jgi:hypothetical protein